MPRTCRGRPKSPRPAGRASRSPGHSRSSTARSRCRPPRGPARSPRAARSRTARGRRAERRRRPVPRTSRTESRNRWSKNSSANAQVGRQVRSESGPFAVGALEPPDEPDPVRREPPQVRVMAAAMPRQVRVAGEPHPRIGQRVHGRQRRAELGSAVDELAQPPEEVAPAIAPRDPPAVTDRQRHLAPGRLQLLGELDARSAPSRRAARRQAGASRGSDSRGHGAGGGAARMPAAAAGSSACGTRPSRRRRPVPGSGRDPCRGGSDDRSDSSAVSRWTVVPSRTGASIATA